MKTLREILPFLVLMQNRNGLDSKSPSYVLEKYIACERDEDCFRLLDGANLTVLLHYLEDKKLLHLYTEEEVQEMRTLAGL